MLRIEMKKALQGVNFRISLLTGLLLVVLHAFWVADYLNTSFIQRVEENGKNAYFLADPSFMQGWIGMDVFSTYGNLFYVVIFPLLAALPYATSLYRDQQTGYDKQVIIRSGKKRYFFAKYAAVFLTAGITVTIPAVISLGIAMSYLPLVPVESFMYQTGVTTLWVNIFYTHPLLYALLYILLDFLIAGTMGILSLAFSFHMKSAFMILVLPMMLNLLLAELLSAAPSALRQLSNYLPYAYTHPGQITYYSGWNVAVGLAVLLLGGGGFYWYQAKKRDILS